MHLSFATDGVSARQAYAGWLLLLAGMLALVILLMRPGGLLLVAAGALFGTIAAKLHTETVRRLADAGWRSGGRQGWATALALLWFTTPVVVFVTGPGVLTTAAILALLGAIGLPLFPASAANPTTTRTAVGNRSRIGGNGIAAAAIFILLGIGLGGGIYNWSNETRAVHERQAEAAEHYVPPPDPLRNEGETGALHP